jgi:hypothetical protein
LTIWAKETAPRFIEKREDMCAAAAQKATGRILSRSLDVVDGNARASGAAQRYRAYTEPIASWRNPIVTG